MSGMTVRSALQAAAAEHMADREPTEFLPKGELERQMQTHMTQSSSLWERLEFYSLPLVEDEEYYDETPTTLVLISLDTPPLVAA